MARIVESKVVAATPMRVRVGEREVTVIFLSEDAQAVSDAEVAEVTAEIARKLATITPAEPEGGGASAMPGPGGEGGVAPDA